ncbi:MAG: hypothetical protein M1824_004071 [Vezdaea acicularis]|nr:MAG: hypothetical protein M1824_004071 [Vezdaea acicularis]
MPHRRGPWVPGEDAYLLNLVQTQGAHNWVRISQLIGSRSPKQCRERYHQNLKPTLNHEPISPEEGILIERLVGEMGKRWAEIARRLNGRSDNAVKNWWNGGMNRRRRLVGRRGENPHQAEFDEKKESLSFARPATASAYASQVQRPIITPPATRPSDTPLPSPSAASDVSTVPSLVSDTGTTFSTSPHVPVSPLVELPPLIGTRAETRRLSLPMLALGSSAFVPDQEARSRPYTARPVRERKQIEPPRRHMPATHHRRQAETSAQSYHYLRHAPAAESLPSLERQRPLPSYMTITAPLPVVHEPRDSRMALSTLLE